MPEFLQFIFSGLTVGAIYALVALGFTLIYNASDVINFAQGEFVMLGGMMTVFSRLAGVPLPLAALIAIVVTVVVGLRCTASPSSRRAAPRRHADHHHHRRLDLPARRRAGRLRQALPQPAAARSAPIRSVIGGATILPQSLVVLAGAVVDRRALWAFIDRTLIGKAMLATAANRLAARLVGINTAPHRRPVVRAVGGDRRDRRHPGRRRSR